MSADARVDLVIEAFHAWRTANSGGATHKTRDFAAGKLQGIQDVMRRLGLFSGSSLRAAITDTVYNDGALMAPPKANANGELDTYARWVAITVIAADAGAQAVRDDAMAALGDLFGSTMPDAADEDECGITLP